MKQTLFQNGKYMGSLQDINNQAEYKDSEFFDLALSIYRGKPIGLRVIELLIDLAPDCGLPFIFSGDKFLFAGSGIDIEPKSMALCIREDINGLCASSIVDRNNNKQAVTTIYLGSDRDGRRLSAGLIYDNSLRRHSGKSEIDFSSYMSRFKIFYDAFSKSKAVKRFLDSNEKIQIVLAEDGLIPVWTSITASDNCRHHVVNIIPDWLNIFVSRLSKGEIDLLSIDNSPVIANINNCTLLGTKYIFLSLNFDMSERSNKRFEDIIRKFAHKVRGKLSAIQASSSQISFQEGDRITRDDVELLKIIGKASESISDSIDSLHSIATLKPGNIEKININRIVNEIIKSETVKYPENNNEKCWDIDFEKNDIEVHGNREQIQSVLTEIIDNALRENRNGSHIRLSARADSEKCTVSLTNKYASSHILNSVKDDKLWEPFFTTDSSRVGLGLNIAQAAIKENGGEIAVNRTKEDEFNVEIRFPVKR